MNRAVKIRKREEKRLRTGHLWLFSNEIERTEGEPGPGDIVDIHRHDGVFLGQGMYNPRSLIAVRILTRSDEPVDASFFTRRIRNALSVRRAIYPDAEAFRLVHGESDGLPGLLVDVYGGTVVLQVLSAGMEARLETITASLQEVLTPDCILARNDSPIRELEGLPLEVRTLSGEPARVTIREHGLSYGVDPVTSQKTGLFLDQRDNRHAIRRYVKGRRVLDCFSNVGGFGMNAAVAGATGVTCVDLSSSSLRTAEENFRANSLEVGEVVEADAFDYLAAMRDEGARFGGIILDPPAFTKNKKTVATALKGYRRLNTLAMSILEENGILVTASCSHHVSREEFLAMVQSSAVRAGRTLRILEFRGAAADHPVLPAMAETEYLKLAICSVT